MREAVPKRVEINQSVAIKSIPKAKICNEIYLLRRELEIIRLADHPNIVKHFETYEDEKYLHIVMELCTGGDILDRLLQTGSLSEVAVAKIMKTLLLAVNHLHGLGIIHRDLKPENFLYGSQEADADIKLIDFGMSNKLEPGLQQLHTMVGTPYYLAPEVLSGSYGKECDLWSLGVVMYVFLSGHQPFQGANLNEIFHKIVKAEFAFEGTEWAEISLDAKDLVTRMIKSNPQHRITVDQALKHPWLTSNAKSSDTVIPSRVLQTLKRYKAPKKLQKEAMKIVVKHMSAEEIGELRNAFIELDREKTGFITAADLEVAMFQAGYTMASEEVKRIDYLQQGKIKYSDFLAATLDKRKYLDEEMIYLAFTHFDSDNDGFITTQDLKTSMSRIDSEVCDDDVQSMIADFDKNHDNKIDFSEFRAMMESLGALTINSSMNIDGTSRRSSAQKYTMSLITAPFG